MVVESLISQASSLGVKTERGSLLQDRIPDVPWTILRQRSLSWAALVWLVEVPSQPVRLHQELGIRAPGCSAVLRAHKNPPELCKQLWRTDNTAAPLPLPCLSIHFISLPLFCNTERGASRPVEYFVFQHQCLGIFSVKALQLLGTSHHCWAHPGWLIPWDRAGQESWMCKGSQMDIFVILICSVTVFWDHTPENVSFCNSWKSQKWKPFQFLQPCLCGRLSHFWDFPGNLSGIRLFPQASRKINIFFCVVVQQVHKQHEKSHLKNKYIVNAKQRSCKKDNTKRKTVKKNVQFSWQQLFSHLYICVSVFKAPVLSFSFHNRNISIVFLFNHWPV